MSWNLVTQRRGTARLNIGHGVYEGEGRGLDGTGMDAGRTGHDVDKCGGMWAWRGCSKVSSPYECTSAMTLGSSEDLLLWVLKIPCGRLATCWLLPLMTSASTKLKTTTMSLISNVSADTNIHQLEPSRHGLGTCQMCHGAKCVGNWR